MSINLVFVLVGTTHTGNLGAAARAMKVMGFQRLRLVDSCSPNTEEAIARASGAGDVLRSASRHQTLDEALSDCAVVVGTSARPRNLSVPLQSCRDVASWIGEFAATVATAKHGEPVTAAVVFGRERSGLSNEELDRCTHHLRIPCDPHFSSLNLGSAVQVVAYEMAQSLGTVPLTADDMRATARRGAGGRPGPSRGGTGAPASAPEEADMPATSAAMEHFFNHLDRVMVSSGFLDPANPRQLRRRLRRYFERNRPNENELSILRGILAATEMQGPNG